MRIVLALLMCVSFAYGQNDTTKYFKSYDYGWSWQRGKFRMLVLPTDTTNNKLGVAQLSNGLYYGNGAKWQSVGGGGGSTNDTAYAKLNYENIFTAINSFNDGKLRVKGLSGGGVRFHYLDGGVSQEDLYFPYSYADSVAYLSTVRTLINGSTPIVTLQDVTENGNTTTLDINCNQLTAVGGNAGIFSDGSIYGADSLTGGTQTFSMTGTGDMNVLDKNTSIATFSLSNDGNFCIKSSTTNDTIFSATPSKLKTLQSAIPISYGKRWKLAYDTTTGLIVRDTASSSGGSFVPYTGATSDVDLGAFALNAQSVKINGTNGNGHLHLRHQASDATATGQSTALFANSNGDLKWKNDGNYYTTLQTYKNTANRVYTYQNKSYTLADSTTLADSVTALRTAINTKQNTLTRPIVATNGNLVSGYLTKTVASTGIDSSGIFQNGNFFGIGTTTPSDYLHLSGSSSSQIRYRVNNTNASGFCGLYAVNDNSVGVAVQMFGSSGTIANKGRIRTDGSTSGLVVDAGGSNPLTLQTADIDRVTVSSSGTVTISNLGTGTVYSNSGLLTNTNPSDSTLKNSIQDYKYGLAEILQLQPKTYYYNSDSTKSSLKYGFLAQEVQQVMPTVIRKLEPNNPDSKLGLESDGIYVAMVKAIQQLEARVKELEAKLNK